MNKHQTFNFALFIFHLLGGLTHLAADASQPVLNTGDPVNSTLSWDSEANFIYFVESTDDLVNWSWQTHHLATSAVPVQLTVPTTTTQTAYRLQYTEFAADNASQLLIGDFDGDGISNYDEINTFATLGFDFLNANTDGIGMDDGQDSDADSDTNTDAYELINGRLALTPDADVNLYSDVILGDDSFTGISAVPNRPTTGDGPKASVTSAISVATDGNIILMQSGSYDETTFALTGTGKNLTLRPNGPVIIQ